MWGEPIFGDDETVLNENKRRRSGLPPIAIETTRFCALRGRYVLTAIGGIVVDVNVNRESASRISYNNCIRPGRNIRPVIRLKLMS